MTPFDDLLESSVEADLSLYIRSIDLIHNDGLPCKYPRGMELSTVHFLHLPPFNSALAL
jgi:hypothetical protein